MSAYTCVGISNTSGNACYMGIEDSFDEAVMGIYTGVLISIPILALAILMVLLSPPTNLKTGPK